MEDRLVPIILNYPEVVLWDTDVGRKKLKIINKGDFPIDDVLNGIGVSSSKLSDSFGITDGKEIKARLELTKFLEARPDFRNWVKSTDLGDLELPLKEESFLKYFNPERASNPFWEKIHEFISFLPESSQTPYGLRVMRDFLKSSLVMEDPEKKMGRMMTEKIEGMATIEGTITLLVNVLKDINEPVYSIKSCQKHAHGYQEYSSSIVNIKFESYPNWVDNKWNPLNWVGFGGIAKRRVDRTNTEKECKAYEERLILEISNSLEKDIINGIKEKLTESHKDKKTDDELNGLFIHVYFVYSKKGLELRIYGIQPSNEASQVFDYAEFQGCTSEHALKIEEARVKMFEVLKQNQNSLILSEFRKRLFEKYPFLFSVSKSFQAESPNTDMEHRWFAVENLYHSYFLKDCHTASCKIRSFFERQIKTLYDVVYIIEKLLVKAEELKIGLCYPDVLEDGHHVVSFKEIFPIHLLSRVKTENIVPIRSLPVLNGQMLGLTGYHGGGKTVTSLAVVTNIFLAQSGLPVFGQGFRLNVKDVLGMMFIERGSGSTCELLLDKIVKILKEIKHVHNSKVVLVLDEVGTGTQEMDGYKLGQDVLSKLSELGVSVLFSTQIMALAEFAKNDLGAQCFKVDEKHNLSPGIGRGGMDSLRRRKGLDKLLK